jgi:hypothetical protein
MGESIAGFRNTSTKMVKIHETLRSGACGANLSFTRTESSTFLAFTQPTNGTVILKYDPATHASQFEERKKDPIALPIWDPQEALL